jgi:endonuclease YncB( thermonuclease family)
MCCCLSLVSFRPLVAFHRSASAATGAFNPNALEDFVPNFATARLVSVYDGDTITVATWEGTRWCKFKVRIYGIDCPEMRTKNPAEQKKAEEAKRLVETALTRASSTLHFAFRGMDKYGRYMCDVFVPSAVLPLASTPPSTTTGLLHSLLHDRPASVPAGHVSVSVALLSRSLAVTYKGDKKNTVNWNTLVPFSAN